MTRIAYVNGAFVPAADATVSVFDRGFLFADAVYEVTAVLDGRLVDNEAHLARLQRSTTELGIPLAVPVAELPAIQRRLVAENRLVEGAVYLQATRGVAERDFAWPDGIAPTLVGFTLEKVIVDNPVAVRGAAVMSMPEQRWARRDIKTVQLLSAGMARRAAHDAGVDDVWFVEDGFVTEGTANNTWIVDHQEVIVTRHLGTRLLPGVTRRAVLEFAEREGIDVVQRPFRLEEAYGAAEAFSTSATSFVLPVVSIDGHAIGDGTPGPMTRRLRAAYIEMARAEST